MESQKQNEWVCRYCDTHNEAYRNQCKTCGQPKPNSNNQRQIIIILLAVILFLSGILIGVLLTGKPSFMPAPESTAEPTATPVPTVTPNPTSTPKPTATPVPTVTPNPTSAPNPTSTPKPTATPVPAATAKPEQTYNGSANEAQRPVTTPKPTPEPTPEPEPIVCYACGGDGKCKEQHYAEHIYKADGITEVDVDYCVKNMCIVEWGCSACGGSYVCAVCGGTGYIYE